ncbi:MAG TPA: hypothetical protein VF290_22220 [Pyrinomonadaceae bacterium]
MLELALAAKSFGLTPADLYGIDIQRAEPALITDFTLVCSLRLIWWDAWIAKKQAEAMEEARNGMPDQNVPPLVIPEYQN